MTNMSLWQKSSNIFSYSIVDLGLLRWVCQIKVPEWPHAGERHGAHCRLRPRLDSCRGSYPHCSHFVRPQRWVSCLPTPKGFPVISHDTIYRPREEREREGERRCLDVSLSLKHVLYKSLVFTRGHCLKHHWMVLSQGPVWLEESGFI